MCIVPGNHVINTRFSCPGICRTLTFIEKEANDLCGKVYSWKVTADTASGYIVVSMHCIWSSSAYCAHAYFADVDD